MMMLAAKNVPTAPVIPAMMKTRFVADIAVRV
jgi:hypothetical protein